MSLKWLGVMFTLSAFLLFMGCEGPEGPQGDTGPQGPGFTTYSYLGNDQDACNHCHSGNVSTWMETGHHEAYDALVAEGNETNLYCVQCHTTGFDAEVSYGDTVVVNPGPDLTGFDDYWPPANAEDSARVAALENVQCEACHGPMGPTIYDHAPILNFDYGTLDSSNPSMCAKCHEQVEEWQESGHGMVLETHGMTSLEEFTDEWDGSSCWTCHTAEGFASDNDPYWAAQPQPELLHLISCQACHDPHDATNEHQLRNLDDYTVLYTVEYAATFTGYGPAQLCVQCHHARRDNDDVQNQINNGSSHFGPHGSPQMDMFLGTGSYEIEGYDYEREHYHQFWVPEDPDDPEAANESCVMCHMEMRSHDDPEGWKGGHDFEPTPATCSVCHPVPDDFDHQGEVTAINEKLDELQAAIGVDPEYYGDTNSTTVEQRMAAYAWQFVTDDGSHGIHNPTYAMDLLQNAIDFMGTVNAARNQGPIAQR